jgi:hypothetical protein
MTSPPIDFQIQFNPVIPPPDPQPPTVTLHTCYRSELPEPQNTQCSGGRNYMLTRCRDTLHLWKRQGRIGGDSLRGFDLDDYLDNISRPAGPSPTPAPSPAASSSPLPDFLGMNEAQINQYCELRYPVTPRPGTSYDRSDSGNYAMSQVGPGMVLHEVGHLMGLRDEYYDTIYPFSPQGEHDSMMNNSRNPAARIFPRHLRVFLEPGSCPASAASGAGP